MIIEDSLLLSNSDGRSITRGCSTLQMVSAVAVSLARISRRCNYRWRWLWLCGWVMELNQQSVSCRYLSNFWSLRIDLDIPPPPAKMIRWIPEKKNMEADLKLKISFRWSNVVFVLNFEGVSLLVSCIKSLNHWVFGQRLHEFKQTCTNLWMCPC